MLDWLGEYTKQEKKKNKFKLRKFEGQEETKRNHLGKSVIFDSGGQAFSLYRITINQDPELSLKDLQSTEKNRIITLLSCSDQRSELDSHISHPKQSDIS